MYLNRVEKPSSKHSRLSAFIKHTKYYFQTLTLVRINTIYTSMINEESS